MENVYTNFDAMQHVSVGGIVVSIAAFQAVDPGSIPGQRTFFFTVFDYNALSFYFLFYFLLLKAVLKIRLHLNQRLFCLYQEIFLY